LLKNPVGKRQATSEESYHAKLRQSKIESISWYLLVQTVLTVRVLQHRRLQVEIRPILGCLATVHNLQRVNQSGLGGALVQPRQRYENDAIFVNAFPDALATDLNQLKHVPVVL
jgi:hypothetical protein